MNLGRGATLTHVPAIQGYLVKRHSMRGPILMWLTRSWIFASVDDVALTATRRRPSNVKKTRSKNSLQFDYFLFSQENNPLNCAFKASIRIHNASRPFQPFVLFLYIQCRLKTHRDLTGLRVATH